MRKRILFVTFLLIVMTSHSQRVCHSIVNLSLIQQQDPTRYTRIMNYENFISTTTNQNNTNQRLINNNGIITIPVVVHILHRGTAIGTQLNISEAQIQSQLDVLNEDFRRLNADRFSTPNAFINIATDFGFEFKLACIDPYGVGTNGVIRKKQPKRILNLNRKMGQMVT